MFSRIIGSFKTIGVFDLSIRILIILLPFTTFLTVLGKVRLGIPWVWFYKEILILLMTLALVYEIYKKRLSIQWWIFDILLGIYMGNLIIISLFTTGISWLMYGGRYDFSFFIIFWVVFHGYPLLQKPLGYYLKLFIVSCGVMLGISALLKFPLSEDLLLYVGYSGNPSNWEFSWTPPIFHGIDGANVRRFQGILDGPNTMWAFLIFYIGIFAYYFRSYRSWYFVNGIIILGLIFMIVYTYSRSALIGIIFGVIVSLWGSLTFIFKKYKKEFLIISILWVLVGWVLSLQFSGKIDAIVGREWSTKWHLERMTAGMNRFIEHPLWQWLGSAGPGYRYVENLEWVKREVIEQKDRYYIPESWYIQQFIEWWLIGGVCFIILMILIFYWLFQKHIFLGSMFMGIGIMNLFLHTFESSPFSLLFFILLGLILWSQSYGKRILTR